MRHFILAVLCATVLMVSAPAQAQPSDLTSLALRYILASEAAMAPNAGPAEIQAVIGFYSDDYVYHHPQFGAKVTGLEAVRRGMTSQIGAMTNPWIEVKGVLVNGEMVTLATVEHFTATADGTKVDRPRTTVLTVRNGRIVQRIDV